MKDQQLDKLEAIIKDAQEEIQRIKNPPVALPRVPHGSRYYFVYPEVGRSQAVHALDKPNSYLDGRYKEGNYFTKEEHAQTKVQWIKDNGQFIAKSIELADGWVPDWSNTESQPKYYVYYNHDMCKWITHSAYGLREASAIYLPTRKKAEELREWCNQFYSLG